jgi:hypothetical protein
MGFEPTIPVIERAKTVHAFDRRATVIGVCNRHEVMVGMVRTGWHGIDTVEKQTAIRRHIFWDITPCNPLRDQQSPACYLFHAFFLIGLFLDPKYFGDVFFLSRDVSVYRRYLDW